MTKDEARREKILNGKLINTIIAISFPIFLYNFFNAAYTLIDSMVASKISSESVSVVTTLSQVKNLLSSLGAGLASGGSIIVARHFGAARYDEAKKNANVLYTMAIVIVALLLLICLPLAVPIIKASGVSKDLVAMSTGYFVVSICDLGFIFFNNIFLGLQKAKANTKLVFYLNIMVMMVKLLLTIIFVYGFHVQNIIWIAVATMIGQSIMFTVGTFIMFNKKNIFKISLKKLGLSWEYVKPILQLSIPIFIGKFVFSFGKVSVNSMCKKYGSLVVGALGVSNHISGLVTSPVNSFEEGESTIVSQNLGNRNIKRALNTFTKTLCITLTIGTIGYILVRFAFQDQLIKLFNQNSKDANAPEFMVLIKSIFYYDSWSIIALAVNSAVLGVLYGFGQTQLSMILNISRVFVFRIPVLWYFQHYHPEMGAECAGISMGISNIGIASMSVVFLVIFLLKIKRRGYNGMYLDDRVENIQNI